MCADVTITRTGSGRWSSWSSGCGAGWTGQPPRSERGTAGGAHMEISGEEAISAVLVLAASVFVRREKAPGRQFLRHLGKLIAMEPPLRDLIWMPVFLPPVPILR